MIPNEWIRACNGATACAEVRWVKAEASTTNGECVQVHPCGDVVWVRDSKLGDASPRLEFQADVWREWLAVVKARTLASYRGPVRLLKFRERSFVMENVDQAGVSLAFTLGEVGAFLSGVRAGEFDVATLAGPDGDAPGGRPESGVHEGMR